MKAWVEEIAAWLTLGCAIVFVASIRAPIRPLPILPHATPHVHLRALETNTIDLGDLRTPGQFAADHRSAK